MKYKNNLSSESKNSYLEVIEPFEVLVPIGKYDSNTYVGSSRMLGVLYKKIMLSPGDYVYDTFGGVYVTYQGGLHPARLQLSDKHPFEKTYGVTEEVWPIAKLKAVDKPHDNYEYVLSVPNISPPKSYYGRGIDAIQ